MLRLGSASWTSALWTGAAVLALSFGESTKVSAAGLPSAGMPAAGVSAVVAIPALAALQEKEKEPEDDPEVDALLEKLEEAYKDRKKSLDTQGIDALTQLAARFDKLNQKQQRAIVKETTQVFRAPRKPNEAALYLAAGEALSRFGDDGAEALKRVAEDRRFDDQEWSPLRVQLIKLLGRPALKKHAEYLIDIATRDPDDLARAAAGQALGSFAKYDQKLRKEIVDKLVKELSSKYNASNTGQLNDTNRQDAQETYNAIQGPWMSTLTKLTGQTEKDPMLWLRWWNNNKRKDWDKLGYVGIEKKPEETADGDKKSPKDEK